MGKKVSGKTHTQQQLDHHSRQLNSNPGTDGTNKTYDQEQGNRGTQMNPERDSGSGSAKK